MNRSEKKGKKQKSNLYIYLDVCQFRINNKTNFWCNSLPQFHTYIHTSLVFFISIYQRTYLECQKTVYDIWEKKLSIAYVYKKKVLIRTRLLSSAVQIYCFLFNIDMKGNKLTWHQLDSFFLTCRFSNCPLVRSPPTCEIGLFSKPILC